MQAAGSIAQADMLQGRGKPVRTELECATHGTYSGFVSVIAGREVKSICPVCEKGEHRKILHSMRVEQTKNKQQAWLDKFGHAGIPPRFLQAAFSNYSATTDSQRSAKALAQSYAEQIAAHVHDGTGLVFMGPSGTGKTHLSCAIARYAIKQGFTALFTSVHELMQVVKATYRRGSEQAEQDVVKMFAETDLLVLDEVGVQHESQHEFVTLTNLINKRYAFLKPTIFLTNLQLPKLETVLGTRIYDRLRQMNECVVCDWDSHRGRV